MIDAFGGVTRLVGLTCGLIALVGCLQIDTEIVDPRHSVRFCGGGFVAANGEEPLRFRWDTARKAYVDQEGQLIVRFGHLSRDAYVVQMRALRTDRNAAADKSGIVVGIVHAAEQPLRVVTPRCSEMAGLARGYGLEVDESQAAHEDVVPVSGPAPGVIGLLVASLTCTPLEGRFVEIVLEPQALASGGVELAALAAKYDPDRFAAPLKRGCLESRAAACAELGTRYAKGAGVLRDSSRAAEYFEKACDAGQATGCLGLAELVEHGDGVTRDLNRATVLYRKACEAGEPFACEQSRRLAR